MCSGLLQSILHQASDFKGSLSWVWPYSFSSLILPWWVLKPEVPGARMRAWPAPCCSQCALGRAFHTRSSTHLSPLLGMCASRPAHIILGVTGHLSKTSTLGAQGFSCTLVIASFICRLSCISEGQLNTYAKTHLGNSTPFHLMHLKRHLLWALHCARSGGERQKWHTGCFPLLQLAGMKGNTCQVSNNKAVRD